MDYKCYDMNAYKLHIIKTDKFKSVTVGVAFRRKIKKEEITLRNLLKEVMINSSYNYPSEKSLIIETENLYDLKLSSSNYRVGNYSIMTFRTRFLNEKYTESGMNEESIKFFLDIIFNPKLDNDIVKCKEKIRKSILSLMDNKVKYSLIKLLNMTGDMPYSYNGYGYLEDIDKITEDDIKKYYDSVISNDVADIYVIGDVCDDKIKNIIREYFKVTTFHKVYVDIIAPELIIPNKCKFIKEIDEVNQTQISMLYAIKGLTDKERKYVLPLYSEMLGGSANSILFDEIREKKNYAYYINSIAKSYDNMFIVYSGISNGNQDKVTKMIDKIIKDGSKNKFDNEKFNNAKNTLVSAIKASGDSPMGIISNYYAKELVDSLDVDERIEEILKVTREDIISLSKKMSLYSIYVLEGQDEKDNN